MGSNKDVSQKSSEKQKDSSKKKNHHGSRDVLKIESVKKEPIVVAVDLKETTRNSGIVELIDSFEEQLKEMLVIFKRRCRSFFN